MQDIIGYLAAFCTTFSFLPQAVMVWRTKNTSSISLSMYSIFMVGVILWLVYGIIMKQLPIILANLITFIFAFSIWFLKIRHWFRNRS